MTDHGVDEARGVRTYTVPLRAAPNAKTTARNRFYISASISRELNGVKESKTAVATGVIVDFTIDTISIKNGESGTFTAWQGISKGLDVAYKLLPERYTASSLYEDEISKLLKVRADFERNNIYPENVETDEDTDQAEYYINYQLDKSEGGNRWIAQSMADRLYVETAQGAVHYKQAEDLPFDIIASEDGNNISVKGTKASSSANMILYTYIYAGGIQKVVETRFTIYVDTFSDQDLPLPIKSASDFLNLNPETRQSQGENTVKPQDYMLENDIVLENYTPFNTSLIRSLDGNGYTIFIKSFNLDKEGALNLSLFNTVGSVAATETKPAGPTILKNLRVNYYNGGQMTIDVSRHKEINVAGLAINNEGVITNCEVVSFYTNSLAGQSLHAAGNAVPCTQHALTKGFNISYRNGANVSKEEHLADNSTWRSQIAGFVLNNGGSITNSRVGGDEILLLSEDNSFGTEQANIEQKKATTTRLDNFSIVGQGDISGFVLTNNGTIASSFAKNIGIKNNSAATKYYSAGFVGVNNSGARVITSYIEGVESDAEEEANKFANTNSSIKSDMGYIAGFTYKNQGQIKDSYSNILIANDADVSKVYLASGFVYENEGRLENCYSASQVANANYSQMNFSGVDKDGSLLKVGQYINCYFFNKEYYSQEGGGGEDESTETSYNTGATFARNPLSGSSFYGFAIAENTTGVHKDGVWTIDSVRGIKLIEPNYIARSHRYKNLVDSNEIAGPSISEEFEDENGNIITRSYVLPYATLVVDGGASEYDTALGGDRNPIIITSVEDWQEISTARTEWEQIDPDHIWSSYITAQVDTTKIKGVYRLVNDVDFSSLAEDIRSTNKNLAGALYGNGFTLSGIEISHTEKEGKDTPLCSKQTGRSLQLSPSVIHPSGA